MKSFEEVWKHIVNCQGEQFSTIQGLPFTYRIIGNALRPSRTAYNISKSDFQKAYSLVPIKGPGVISQLVRGPAYVWAILYDPRITT